MRYFAIILLFLYSCNDDKKLSDLKSPVVLIGKNIETSGSVTVMDANGTAVTFSNSGLAENLYSRNLGDTIK